MRHYADMIKIVLHHFLNNQVPSNFKIVRQSVWTNSVDHDQTAPEEQSDLGLHCFHFEEQNERQWSC